MKLKLFFISLVWTLFGTAQEHPLEGHWLGVPMYQDENTYDGRTFYLPNKEFMVVEGDEIKIYLYPYSKSDEFKVRYDENTINYSIGRKRVKTQYEFIGASNDTLKFSMFFINKTFVKLFERVTDGDVKAPDTQIIKQLDEFGFNPASVPHEFELDTFHQELYSGFDDLDSLNFTPYSHIQFTDQYITVNRAARGLMKQGYKTVTFPRSDKNGQPDQIRIVQSEGTQMILITPTSLCQCDSIVIPYLTTSWAERIRLDMIENKYKYR